MTLPNFLLEANPVGNPYPKVMKYTSSFSNNPRKRNQKFNKKPPIEFNLPKMKSTWANYTDHSPLVDQAKWWFRIREFSQKTPLVQVWELYADLPRYVAFKVIAQFPHLIFWHTKMLVLCPDLLLGLVIPPPHWQRSVHHPPLMTRRHRSFPGPQRKVSVVDLFLMGFCWGLAVSSGVPGKMVGNLGETSRC